MVQSLLTRLEGLFRLLENHAASLHPPQKQWSKFVCDGENKESKDKIMAFIKCDKLISVGTFSSVASKFFDSVKAACDACTNDRIRQWFAEASKENQVVADFRLALQQAKLALAVAVAAKAVWVKLPKLGQDAEGKKARKTLVAGTKRHIVAAKVDKALCGLVCMHVSDVLRDGASV